MSGQDLVSDQGLRVDGRRANELRQIRVRMGVFGQSDGSAYLEQGNTKVLAAVYGPHQPRGGGRGGNRSGTGIINCQYSMAVFSFSAGERKKRPRGDRKTQETSLQLRRAIEAIVQVELYPRSQIDVFVEVLQSDGSDYCAAVNAATLALIDAGIPIKDYSVGCTATIASMGASEEVDSKDETGSGTGIVDANHMEECTGATTLTVVALPGAPGSNYESDTDNSGLVVVAQGTGARLHLSRLEGLRQRALQGCRDTRVILDQAVRFHLTTHDPHFI
ncbi:exosome complex component RRP41 [Neodiprion pinetum]|uniref:Exosome complex component RRP41 n=1 Tax=Neodiprion lecontei TaxID=441921 RepID=A0A6J0C3Y4_NEOLC|nr:exosome complex component RRP41 [Neodiprion lecontei]XP_046472006.1 exosome complex component RRP41 [Neodiprion pinetum]